MVQPNLFEALKGIRKEDEEICLWVDGICINQADTTERNHQVGLMGDIYRNAKNVRAWLGPAGEESDFVLEFVERDGDRFRREKAGETLEKIPESEEKAFVDAFRALHRRPYWGRAWIKQEVILAKELVIHCGTKSADGLRLFVLAHWHCFTTGGFRDEIASLSMHRLNLQEGKREPLEILLKRYGRTGCTDARDRVFSVLSIASDTEGLEETIADYSVKTPALFFALLRITEPQNVISLATSLHEILGVRRAELLEYWDKIQVSELAQGMKPPTTSNKLENMGIGVVWGVKATKKILEVMKELRPAYVKGMESSSGREFASFCQLMSLKPFLARICQLLDSDHDLRLAEDNQEGSQEDNREERKTKDYTLLRISNTDFFIMAHKTFFGLRFKHIFIRVDDPSSEGGYNFDPIFPNISPEQLKPFMIYPRIILQKRSAPLAEATISNIVNKKILIEAFWGQGRGASARGDLLHLIGIGPAVWK
jgi:hypothetical protein